MKYLHPYPFHKPFVLAHTDPILFSLFSSFGSKNTWLETLCLTHTVCRRHFVQSLLSPLLLLSLKICKPFVVGFAIVMNVKFNKKEEEEERDERKTHCELLRSVASGYGLFFFLLFFFFFFVASSSFGCFIHFIRLLL